MTYTVANQSVPADTSTGKTMGAGNTAGNKFLVSGFLAAAGTTGYTQVSAGTTGPGTGAGKNTLPMAGMSTGIMGGKNDDQIGKTMKTGNSPGTKSGTHKGFL